MKAGFTVKKVNVKNGVFTYQTHRVSGWLNGRRIRKHFKSKAEAEGEKDALEIAAANRTGLMRPRNTRLSEAQLADAESAIFRLGGKSFSGAVDWFLENYKPPVEAVPLESAVAAFLAARKPHVRALALRDYGHTLTALAASFSGRSVHTLTTADVEQFLQARNVGKKRWNNLRGDLHAFFEFCVRAPRQWTHDNPVKPITIFRIARGVPLILTVARAAELMAYVEGYAGGRGTKLRAGCLVPYFALTLFAGIRPSIPGGEICRLAALSGGNTKCGAPDSIDLTLNVIRISPEVSKVNSVRQVTIQPNLKAWLTSYPLDQFPILPYNARRMVDHVRKKFELSHDVNRHTFISMHVAKFRSIGEAGLQAGNSEAMVKKHYLNLVTEADALRFWSISPIG